MSSHTQRLRKTQKDGKGEQEEYNEETDCPVPYISCVCKGLAIPASLDGSDGGIRMRCKNDRCHLTKILIHKKCFDQLEETLLKILSNLGSARGWTDAQLRSNLWEKKGQTLIAKLLRCHCGQGLMNLDVDFYKKRELEEHHCTHQQVMADAKQRKKKKSKFLPSLNFTNNGPVAPELLQNDFVPAARRFSHGQSSHSASALIYDIEHSDDSEAEHPFERKSVLLSADRPKSKTPELAKPIPLFRHRKDSCGKGRKSLPVLKTMEAPLLQQKTSCSPITLKVKRSFGSKPANKISGGNMASDGKARSGPPKMATMGIKGGQQLGEGAGKQPAAKARPQATTPIMDVMAKPQPSSDESGSFYSLFDPGSRSFNLGEILLGESRLPGLITKPRLLQYSA